MDRTREGTPPFPADDEEEREGRRDKFRKERDYGGKFAVFCEFWQYDFCELVSFWIIQNES